MKYTFEKGKKSTVKIEITLTEKEWNESINQAYEKNKGKYSLPGFRKGKVPKHLLESTYGKGVFYEEAINYAFPKYYSEVLDKETSIEPVAAPDIDVKKISEKGITLVADVAVKPEVKLGAYKGISFKKNEYNVTDKDIEEDLKSLQERNARMIDVTDRECKEGDTVTIDFSGSIDGKKFEGGTAEKQPLTIGEHKFIPGFEEQVAGMKIGEERDITVKFPEDYFSEDLKGKDAVFAIKLHEIKTKELPEINDEFIKDAVGSESVEAYKGEVKEKLAKQNGDKAERELEDAIIKQVTDTSEVEIPDAMIEGQIDRMVQEMSYRLSYQGLKMEDYLKYTNQTMEDYRKGYTESATANVKTQLVIGAIIDAEKIEATDEDVEAKVAEMAKSQGREVPDVKKNLGARQLDYVKNEIVIKKFFDLLKSANEIK